MYTYFICSLKQFFGSGSGWIQDFSSIWIVDFLNYVILMLVLIRFWRSLAKMDAKSARYEIKHYFYFYHSFMTFFHGSGSRFFRIRSGFMADPDPDSEKKGLIRIRKKGSETLL